MEELWNTPQDAIPPPWRAWLLHAGSFMQRLAQYGIQDAHIHVLQQCWQLPMAAEGQLLRMDLQTPIWVREVFIASPKKQWMVARTVVPRSTLAEKEHELTQLGNRSLGSILFNDPTIKRSEFRITCLSAETSWHVKAVETVQHPLPDLWARRSLFSLRNKPLVLTEIFLPDVITV